MLSFNWDIKDTVYNELLKPSGTITGEVCRQQLLYLKQSVQENQPK